MTVPDLAWMVITDVPAGVDGVMTSLELEQPAKKPAETTRMPSKPRSLIERCCRNDRRGKINIAPKGSRSATVIPAAFP